MSLEKLSQDLENNKISISDTILKALPILKDSQPDNIMAWLSDELQGYRNPLDFYYQNSNLFPPYRVIKGSLKLMNQDGNLVNVDHPLVNTPKHFLSAPVSWLEESYGASGDQCYVEMPGLSHDKREIIVLECSRYDLQRVLAEIKGRLRFLLK